MERSGSLVWASDGRSTPAPCGSWGSKADGGGVTGRPSAFGRPIGSFQAIQHHCANIRRRRGNRSLSHVPGGIQGQGLDQRCLPGRHGAGPPVSWGHRLHQRDGRSPLPQDGKGECSPNLGAPPSTWRGDPRGAGHVAEGGRFLYNTQSTTDRWRGTY